MPSAKLEKQASADACDPIKNVLTIVEKKVRNLEKRKGKLDSYRQDSQNGKELNDDQKKAVEKYDQVLEVLDFAKDLQKQFQGVIQESTKAQKRAARRELLEKQQQELQRIKELMVYQDLLNSMGGEDVRKDFLHGTNRAVQLTESELNELDELYKAICPERDLEAENNSDFEQQIASAADHVQSLLNSKNKEVFGTTYKSLKETLLKIQSSSYFNKNQAEASNEAECESNQSSTEEKDTEKTFCDEQYAIQPEENLHSPVEESILAQQGGMAVSQAERPYYMESSSLYTEQTHPIQEVLSIQGNLNFLQESQIEVESSQATNSSVAAPHPVATYPTTTTTMQYATTQSAAATGVNHPMPPLQHKPPVPQRLNNEMAIPPPTSVLIANSTHPVTMAATGLIQPPVAVAADFDPTRPIPSQTYTNQSFSSPIHPMMTQSYNPVTLPHPATLSPSMTMKHNVAARPLTAMHQLEQAQVAPAIRGGSNVLAMAVHSQGSGSVPTLLPQVSMDSFSLTKNVQQHMTLDRDSSQSVQSANIPSPYECNEIEGAYQSTNSSQAYMNRESFGDDSSYSSNLKRGLTSRGGARGGGAPRINNTSARGPRTTYRN